MVGVSKVPTIAEIHGKRHRETCKESNVGEAT